MSEAKKTKKEDKFSKLEKQCKEYLDGWQRAKADYSNLQKETAKEREHFARFAKTQWIMQVLPLYNNLQTAYTHLPDNLKDDQWVQGVAHIKDQFTAILKEMKVEAISSIGKFDASLHEAVSKETQKGKKSGEIIRQVEAGYTIDDEVLIPAKVVVAE